jgi:hypothetical protein
MGDRPIAAFLLAKPQVAGIGETTLQVTQAIRPQEALPPPPILTARFNRQM